MSDDSVIGLLLEDEPLIAMSIEQEISDFGYTITTVDTCKNAHLWLDSHTPRVVIVDIQLKDGSSVSFVERLVEAGIPFLVHSGDNPANYKGTPFAMGGWVGKPARMEDLSTYLFMLTS